MGRAWLWLQMTSPAQDGLQSVSTSVLSTERGKRLSKSCELCVYHTDQHLDSCQIYVHVWARTTTTDLRILINWKYLLLRAYSYKSKSSVHYRNLTARNLELPMAWTCVGSWGLEGLKFASTVSEFRCGAVWTRKQIIMSMKDIFAFFLNYRAERIWLYMPLIK